MIFKKGFLATIAAGGLLGNSLFARDVESTKESSSFLQRMLPEAYSSMSVMHQNSSDASKNRWKLRYNLGSTFLDEKLDVKAVFGVNKHNESTILQDRGTRLEMTHSTYEGEYYTFNTFAGVWFPSTSDKGYQLILGVENKLAYSMEATSGTFNLIMTQVISGLLGTKANMVGITQDGKVIKKSDNVRGIDKRFSLSGDVYKAEQKSSNISHELGVNLSFEPNFATNVTLSASGSYYQEFSPKAVWNKKTKDVDFPKSMIGLPKYEINDKYSIGAVLGYEWSEDMTMELAGTFYAKDSSKVPYDVVGSVSVALF
jgi:hypothetical protein